MNGVRPARQQHRCRAPVCLWAGGQGADPFAEFDKVISPAGDAAEAALNAYAVAKTSERECTSGVSVGNVNSRVMRSA